MITSQEMYQATQKYDFTFFAGVPDSTFKEWLKFLEQGEGNFQHVSTSNEADAVAIASGYHLATKKVPVAYMQNSGLGNAVNPLTSLVDKEVYSIPMVLLIGWRGMPGVKDEPQHIKMGRIMLAMLDVLEIPYETLSENPVEMEQTWAKASAYTKEKNAPYAIILRPGIFAPYEPPKKAQNSWTLEREKSLQSIVNLLSEKHAIIATTGHVSRELYDYRDSLKQGHDKDFYTVGSMGCSTAIGMGIALANPQREVVVFDADGAALMHLGSWPIAASYKLSNLKHIVFDNECYESTGAQPTVSPCVDFAKIALACGYLYSKCVSQEQELKAAIEELLHQKGPALLVIKIKRGHRSNLGRPKTKPVENKIAFMDFLNRE